jgi:hypothetical protein
MKVNKIYMGLKYAHRGIKPEKQKDLNLRIQLLAG